MGFKVDFGMHATTCSTKYRGVTWPLTRPIPRCLYGANLATQTEFDAQKKEADKVLAHWELYVKIFHRMANRALVVGDLCCSQGGASIGIRRLQAIPVGADIEYQQHYVDNFGEGSFVQADATNEDIIAQLSQLEAVGALKELDGLWASPPCQGSSQLPKAGGGLTDSSEPRLIGKTREMLKRSGKPWIIENVMGAISQGDLEQHLCLRNVDFGLRACRPRAFESSFPLYKELDSRKLAKRCCLGNTTRLPRLDFMGRRVKGGCCNSNWKGVYSTPSLGVTIDDWFESMDIEPGSMSARGLALSIPPKFSQLLVS